MKDAPLLFVRRKGQVLEPYARFDADLLERHREGVKLRIEVTEPRALPFQRLYWSVLGSAAKATGKWPNAETLHRALKLHLGCIEEIASVNGEVVVLPGSTAFRNMDQRAFSEYAQAAFEVITTDILPGLTIEDILALGNARLAPGERAA